MGVPSTDASSNAPSNAHSTLPTFEQINSWGKEECEYIKTNYESTRGKIVLFAKDRLPEQYAKIVEKISHAVPEIFAGICCITGAFTIPALLIFTGRSIISILPTLKTLFSEISAERSGKESAQKAFNELKIRFEQIMVPALSVYLAVDAIFSLFVGVTACDCSRILRAVAISTPAALLAFKHLWQQAEVTEETTSPGPSTPSIPSIPSTSKDG